MRRRNGVRRMTILSDQVSFQGERGIRREIGFRRGRFDVPIWAVGFVPQ